MGKPIAEIGFYLYWYHIVYIFFAFYSILVFHSIGKNVLVFIAVLIVYSLLTYQYSVSLVLKQLINLTFVIFVSYCFIRHEKFDFNEIFRKYSVCCKVVLTIGFIQVLLFSLGLESLYFAVFPYLKVTNINVRMQSVTLEPSFLSYTFVPILFISFYNLFYNQVLFFNKKWSVAFVIGVVLTFSAVSYFIILLTILLLYFQNFTLRKLSYLFYVLFGISVLVYIAYQNLEEIKKRIDDTYFGITEGIIANDGYIKVNLSTYSLLSNAYATKRSLEDQPLTGAGLGNYSVIYDKYIPSRLKEYIQLSREEASSLGLRLLAETGLIGFLAFCFFILKFRIKSNALFSPDEKFLWLFNSSIFALAISLLLRSGDYSATGRILFFLIYYYTYCKINNSKEEFQGSSALT
jgi:hypothetical protein